MTGGELASALRSGRRVYGVGVVSTSPHWPPAVKALGVDFVFLDTEHIATDRERLAWMCQTYRALGMAPIVRIPAPDPYQACMALDGGAAGIVAPYLETPEQIQSLRGAVKVRPLKGRRLQAALENAAALENLADYINRRCAENVLIANIESVPALENIGALLSVPGLDAVLVGPHDMTTSLGIPEQYTHPAFDAAIRGLIQAARGQNVGVGVHHWWDVAHEAAWAQAGANLLLHSSDLTAFQKTLASELAELKKTLGDD